jgi:hypothetical protein
VYTLFLKSNQTGSVAAYKQFLDASNTHTDGVVNPQTQRNATNYVRAVLKDIRPSRFKGSETANYFVTAEEPFLLPEGFTPKTKPCTAILTSLRVTTLIF